jgi:hypothetical protein
MNFDQIAIIVGLVVSFSSQFWQFFKILSKIEQKVGIVEFNEVKFQVAQLTKERTEDKTSIQAILLKMENISIQLSNITIQYQHLAEMMAEIRQHERE